ncbi:MAG: signal peptidase I [Clostridia bacterium]|nr:signal peptidase I [Clostridia bacterium]
MKIRNVLFNILAIVTVLAVGFVGFNLLSGAKGYAVTSDSMKDTLNTGDVVFVKSVTFDELQVGDVITVASSGGERFFTHRIVEINKTDRTVTTRGDANGADDPMPTEEERIVGRMWYSVPLLGFITIGFSYVSQSAGLLILAAVAVVFVVLNSILTKSKKRRGESDE